MAQTQTSSLFGAALRARLRAAVDAADRVAIKPYRATLAAIDELLFAAFSDGVDADDLVHERAECLDSLLIRAWRNLTAEVADDIALVAVGGYGRGELLPASDIDLLVVYREGRLAGVSNALEAYITFVWDIGLEVGHSVRSPAECAEAAADDVTVITNLIEARLLSGPADLLQDMQARLAPGKLWPVETFFKAKLKEQAKRYRRYEDSAYQLEPNTKESPGGLRDIQTIAWVAKRHFGSHTLNDLVAHGFLTQPEYIELRRGQTFLWRVRFALHMITGRCEDRLLFDHQIQVASLFGYVDAKNNLSVEQLMQRYYRNIKALSALNDVLLQLFSEAILHAGEDTQITPINARFQARHNFIEVRDDAVFRRNPRALLEIFYLLQTRPRLTGIRAETLRLIRRDRHLIDVRLRADVRCRRLFFEILRQRGGVTRALRRMNSYGVLGRYLPAFGRIIGRMQYDLFHTLTVDEHSLFVVRNLRRLCLPRFDHELPLASRITQELDRQDLMMVAGLFHDIAKGRGGDHSALGADDAAAFCRDHGISSYDATLVCWLVRQHLLMSMTAQRRDINDPAVVHAFAQEVGSRDRLDRLFVFTICDIRATNPNLWNSWKETLLTELYNNTARALARGLENPLQESELVAETRSAAAALLTRHKVNTPHFRAVWARFQDDYFLRHNAREIAWHTRTILAHDRSGTDGHLVCVDDIAAAGTTVFIYGRDRNYLFGVTTGVLAQLGLSILDARIDTTNDGYTVDSYAVTEGDGRAIAPGRRYREIEQALRDVIADPDISKVRVTRQPSRRSRAFSVPTQVSFRQELHGQATVMELVTADRPGLLSTVGEIFRKRGVRVDNAKIATIGERAEDVFYITDGDHQPLSDPALSDRLQRLLTRALDRLQNPRRLT